MRIWALCVSLSLHSSVSDYNARGSLSLWSAQVGGKVQTCTYSSDRQPSTNLRQKNTMKYEFKFLKYGHRGGTHPTVILQSVPPTFTTPICSALSTFWAKPLAVSMNKALSGSRFFSMQRSHLLQLFTGRHRRPDLPNVEVVSCSQDTSR